MDCGILGAWDARDLRHGMLNGDEIPRSTPIISRTAACAGRGGTGAAASTASSA
jgi:hypothetical protein